MSDLYPITMEQLQTLDSYTCERLTANSENKRLLHSFYNRRMPHLAVLFQTNAWEEDQRGYPMAYYVVKNPAGEIAMVFALRCGVLFDTGSLKYLMDKKERYDMLINSMGNEAFTVEMRRELLDLYHEVQKYEFLMEDIRFDSNKSMLRVTESYPAIELVYLCLNDCVSDAWHHSGMQHKTMGETLFWRFLIPKVQEIANLVGCQYLYTFVADDHANGALINYFRNVLHFSSGEHLGTAKPIFDFMCTMLYQPIYPMDHTEFDYEPGEPEALRGIVQWREEFFRYFNNDPNSGEFV